MDSSELGKRVKMARAYAGFTRAEDMAQLVGIGRNQLLAIEAGTTEANPWVLIAIARICGLPEAWFFREELADPKDAGPMALDEVIEEMEQLHPRSQRKEQTSGD